MDARVENDDSSMAPCDASRLVSRVIVAEYCFTEVGPHIYRTMPKPEAETPQGLRHVLCMEPEPPCPCSIMGIQQAWTWYGLCWFSRCGNVLCVSAKWRRTQERKKHEKPRTTKNANTEKIEQSGSTANNREPALTMRQTAESEAPQNARTGNAYLKM